jgi:hypothetical protein
VTVCEVSEIVKKTKHCCLGLMHSKGTKYGYIIGDTVYEVGPDGRPRPWEFTLDELVSDQWIAADRP